MNWHAELLAKLETGFEGARDAERAVAMARYMRDLFPFFGIPSRDQRRTTRAAAAGLGRPSEGELTAFAVACWSRDEREWQYAACDALSQGAKRCSPALLATVRTLITTKSWWDTVDTLSSHAVGDLVRVHPALATTMDRWISSKNFWLARTAILHQLRHKADTDAARLFDYCARRASDREFFIRKAIGWALREYSKTDPDAVRTFVEEHPELSPLSKREALRRL